MSKPDTIKIALAGTPNSGKTSVFNRLTGLNQHVGNYPGVTVDKKVGNFEVEGTTVNCLDLPGTHSLYPISADERVVLDVLLDQNGQDYPDFVIYVANAANLSRSLLLLTQISDLGIPVMCCLNMQDLAQKGGLTTNSELLASELGMPVHPINARTGEGLEELKHLLINPPLPRTKPFPIELSRNTAALSEVKRLTGIQNEYAAQLISCQFENLNFLSNAQKDGLSQLKSLQDQPAIRVEVEDKTQRIDAIEGIVKRTTNLKKVEGNNFTSKIDHVLTHSIWGTAIFLLILAVLFQSIFFLAQVPMDLIDGAFASLNEWLHATLSAGLFTDFLTDGLITGIGGIVIFIPQIAILFTFVAMLEESGYMTRAVYLSDNLMKNVGLNGRSLVSLISGVACAVPAIMSARTIGNWKERLITIFVTPFISCSARVPVYVVLVAFVVPADASYGPFNAQGLVMMGLYLLGVVAAIGSAWIMKKVLRTRERSMLILEMPAYQWPLLKNVWITVFEKSKVFVVRAGQIILVVSIILWTLASFGPGNDLQEVEEATIAEYANTDINPDELNNIIASRQLEASYVGHLGKFIEPAIKPLGFDWKIGIALITSFAAREVFVSTMATIYSTGSDDEMTIIERMRTEKTADGALVYTPARSLSLLLFYVFALQCMSTLAIVKRETKSWAIPFYQFIYMTTIAYLASFIGYNLMG